MHPLPDPRRSGAGFPPGGKEQNLSPLGENERGYNIEINTIKSDTEILKSYKVIGTPNFLCASSFVILFLTHSYTELTQRTTEIKLI
jgi:hypothetical protein